MFEINLLDLLRASGAIAVVLGAICLALKEEAPDQGLGTFPDSESQSRLD